MSKWKVPVQSLIDHIKTAVDVDPWAKEMAEELLKEQDNCENCTIAIEDRQPVVRCKDCVKRRLCCIRRTDDPEWFCADGEGR